MARDYKSFTAKEIAHKKNTALWQFHTGFT